MILYSSIARLVSLCRTCCRCGCSSSATQHSVPRSRGNTRKSVRERSTVGAGQRKVRASLSCSPCFSSVFNLQKPVTTRVGGTAVAVLRIQWGVVDSRHPKHGCGSSPRNARTSWLCLQLTSLPSHRPSELPGTFHEILNCPFNLCIE